MGPEIGPTEEDQKQFDDESHKIKELDEPTQEKEEFKSESLAFITQDPDGRCKHKHIFYTQPDGTISIRECKMVFRDKGGWEDTPFSYRNLRTPSEVMGAFKSKLDGSWHLEGSDGKEREITKKTKRIGYGGIDSRLKIY